MSLMPGAQLGPYRILAALGAGGMGEVYRARDTRLERDMAVKVLPAAFTADAERLRRFETEARAAGQLTHPNILAIHDFSVSAGVPYLVTERLEGETLRQRLAAASARGASAATVRPAPSSGPWPPVIPPPRAAPGAWPSRRAKPSRSRGKSRAALPPRTPRASSTAT
ncbi:MAG: protein kinase domain-containing protein [Terriglobales bacterium]